jgi:hypothetical protein
MVGLLWPDSDPEANEMYNEMFNMAEVDAEAAEAIMKDRHLNPPSRRPTHFSEKALDDWTDKLVDMRKRYMDHLPVLAARFADGEYEFSKEWCSVVQKRVTQRTGSLYLHPGEVANSLISVARRGYRTFVYSTNKSSHCWAS